MGFLDNSGDIILDAVLTDTGRMRLAKGDGSFRISKFALGDDEINYGLYDKDHLSGSAYYDINILQTPVLEAFTNNTSTMKSKLITISRTNLLYLPVIKLNTGGVQPMTLPSPARHSSGYLVAVNSDTVTSLGTLDFINGYNVASTTNIVVVDQGIDNTNKPATTPIDPDLKETQYIVHLDHRLGTLASHDGTLANYSFLDDDNIATYYFSTAGTTGNNSGFAMDIGVHDAVAIPVLTNFTSVAGQTGSRLVFSIKASDNLENSNFLFDQIGLSANVTIGSTAYKAIDSIIKIMGGTTGYSIEIPIRFLKKA